MHFVKRNGLWLLLLCLPMWAHAEQWTKTYAVTGKPTLRVNTDDADVRIHSCDCKQVEARVDWSGYKPGQVRVTESQSGDDIDLSVHTRAHDSFFIGWSNRWVHIDVAVPKELALEARTGDGRITVENVSGDLDVKTGDGKMEISGVEGLLRAHSGDGEVRASGRFDGVDVTTSDGSVEIAAKQGSAVRSTWSIRSGDGAVHVRLPAGFAADLRAQTGDGNIHSELPITVSGDLKEKSRLEGKVNGGGGTLTIHTGDGDVYLEKE